MLFFQENYREPRRILRDGKLHRIKKKRATEYFYICIVLLRLSLHYKIAFDTGIKCKDTVFVENYNARLSVA